MGQEMDKSSLFLLTWSFLLLSLSQSNSCPFAHSSSMSLITVAGVPVVFTTTPFPLLLAIILTPEQDRRVRGAIVAPMHRRRVSSPACSCIPSWSPDHSHCRYSASPHHSQRNHSSSSERSPPHRRRGKRDWHKDRSRSRDAENRRSAKRSPSRSRSRTRSLKWRHDFVDSCIRQHRAHTTIGAPPQPHSMYLLKKIIQIALEKYLKPLVAL